MKLYRLFLAIIFSFVLLISGINLIKAQSANLENVNVILDNANPSVANVNQSIGFKLPKTSLNIITTDYIQINLPNFTSVSASSISIDGQSSGTPVVSVDGTTVKITGIFVMANREISITGITATNPASTNLFNAIITITEDEAGALVKNYGTTMASSHPGTVTMSATLEQARAIIRITGFTGPQTFVSFTEGENVIGTDMSSALGVFSKYFSGLEPGVFDISLYGVDSSNRATSILPLSINAPAFQTTTISNLLLSPTLEISDTEVLQGQDLYATGSAYPGTEVTIFTDTPLRTYTASTSAAGVWTTTISDTENYTPGDYRIYTLAQLGSLQSVASRKIVFSIVTSPGGTGGTACGDISQGDLNCDGDINLTDFSILMYYWSESDSTADINGDDVVNLTDFSILMYYWGS